MLILNGDISANLCTTAQFHKCQICSDALVVCLGRVLACDERSTGSEGGELVKGQQGRESQIWRAEPFAMAVCVQASAGVNDLLFLGV